MLDKGKLKQDILNIFSQERDEQESADASAERIATKLSDAVDAFVRSATVTVNAGIPVSTTGSATAQTGATTANGTAVIR